MLPREYFLLTYLHCLYCLLAFTVLYCLPACTFNEKKQGFLTEFFFAKSSLYQSTVLYTYVLQRSLQMNAFAQEDGQGSIYCANCGVDIRFKKNFCETNHLNLGLLVRRWYTSQPFINWIIQIYVMSIPDQRNKRPIAMNCLLSVRLSLLQKHSFAHLHELKPTM